MSSAPDTDPELADMTIDEIVAHNERHGGALTIEYKGYQIVVPRRDIEGAIAFIRDLPPTKRAHYAAEVQRAIDKAWPRVVARRASTKHAVECCVDSGSGLPTRCSAGAPRCPRRRLATVR
jgi:hypothetical protein